MNQEKTTQLPIPLQLKQVAAIAYATLVESIQQPIALLLLLSAILTTLLTPLFQFHRFGEDGRLARDSGFSCMLIFGLALVIGTAGSAVCRDIERGTAATAIAKPVPRAVFVVAKWLGSVGVAVLFWLGTLSALMLSERGASHFMETSDFSGHVSDNIALAMGVTLAVLALVWAAARQGLRQRRFGLSAFCAVALSQPAALFMTGFFNRMGQLYIMLGSRGETLLYKIEINTRVVPVAILLLLAISVFAALAIALATRFGSGVVLWISLLALFTGLAGDAIWAGAPLSPIRGLVAGAIPNIQNLWLCDAIARDGVLPWSYVWQASLYALSCAALFLIIGCRAFNTRDLG